MKLQKRKNLLVTISVLLISVLVIFSAACSQTTNSISNVDKAEHNGIQKNDNYTLEQMTILSRHNVRATDSKTKPTYTSLTPHQWIDWGVPSGKLAFKGGQNEISMGQYFRQFLEEQKVIPEDWIPQDNETYFYANSYQRTIATANYFATGLIPVKDQKINYGYEVGKNDPLFRKALTIQTDKFLNQVKKEVANIGGSDDVSAIGNQLTDNYKILENVLDFKNSEYAKEKNIEAIAPSDIDIELKPNARPVLKGSIDIGNSASDALKQQYYLEPNDKKAAFDNNISYEDWEKIAQIQDVYLKAKCGTYTASLDVANPLLKELKNCMTNKDRKVSFFCGHDTTIIPILTALKVKEYNLDNAIEKLAPIGSKVLIQKYKNKQGEEYCTISFVYASVDQIRNCSSLSLDNPPMQCQLELDGLEKNSDGLYKYSDVIKRFDDTIQAYENLANSK